MEASSSSSSAAYQANNRYGQILWPEAPSMMQNFDLPESIIYFVAKNPSTPEVYLKMAKSCKYFFENNPIIVARRVHGGKGTLCSNDYEKCKEKKERCCVKCDISKITNSKIWILDELTYCSHTMLLFNHSRASFASTLLSKLYRSENAKLSFFFGRILFDDFKLVSAKFQKFCLFGLNIFYKDDDQETMVELDKILESVPVVKEFAYFFHGRTPPPPTASTIMNIFKLKNLGDLRKLAINDIPELPVSDLSNFIMDRKDRKIRLYFRRNISDEYKQHLNQLINTVLEKEEVLGHLIEYEGQDRKKLAIMRSRNAAEQ